MLASDVWIEELAILSHDRTLWRYTNAVLLLLLL